MADSLDLLDGFFERRADVVEWVRPEAETIAFLRLHTGRLTPT